MMASIFLSSMTKVPKTCRSRAAMLGFGLDDGFLFEVGTSVAISFPRIVMATDSPDCSQVWMVANFCRKSLMDAVLM